MSSDDTTSPETTVATTSPSETATAVANPSAGAALQAAAQTPVLEKLDDRIDIDHFAKVQLRVATIESAELVPKSSKLYKLQLDVGSLGKRQIVSGIAKHYTPEQLVGKQIVIIANLKPAKLMGVESHGMLLAASTEGDAALALLTPDKEITAGSTVR